ncbi:MAG: type I restriction enzyme HsdR N-terminal domain-containing protein [Sphingobacteriales bacterium]|nr:MAG: type I restriction enzyme HsdR N-terminal domain-containing protein [Sphingobacteriales bacterium]
MIEIIFPAIKPSLKTEKEKQFIFCVIRKKWMQLTPEEWVRQNVLLYLIHTLQYPSSLIAVEKQLLLGEMKKRFDIVVYKNDKPFVLIECKEMNVPISQKTLDQVMRYNINLQATSFIITNGNTCYGFTIDAGILTALRSFPAF